MPSEALKPRSPLQEAYAIAKTHHLRLVPVQERRDPAVPGDYITAWVVYGPTGRLGRRRDPAELVRYLKTLTEATDG